MSNIKPTANCWGQFLTSPPRVVQGWSWPLGVNFVPRGKVIPRSETLCSTLRSSKHLVFTPADERRGEQFPREQNSPLGAKFTPRRKTWPQPSQKMGFGSLTDPDASEPPMSTSPYQQISSLIRCCRKNGVEINTNEINRAANEHTLRKSLRFAPERRRHEQGDQMSLWKSRPKCGPNKFLSNFACGKKCPTNSGYFSNFQKNCPKKIIAQKAKIRPIWSPWTRGRRGRGNTVVPAAPIVYNCSF
jgi:nicotinamidase-related amidase